MNNGADFERVGSCTKAFYKIWSVIFRFEIEQVVFTSDKEWMERGWDSKQPVFGCYLDRIPVIRG
jgi:hypothetical protein